MQFSFPNRKFLLQVKMKATIIHIQLSQYQKYTWILFTTVVIINGGLYTRQSMKKKLNHVRYLLMSVFNNVKIKYIKIGATDLQSNLLYFTFQFPDSSLAFTSNSQLLTPIYFLFIFFVHRPCLILQRMSLSFIRVQRALHNQ